MATTPHWVRVFPGHCQSWHFWVSCEEWDTLLVVPWKVPGREVERWELGGGGHSTAGDLRGRLRGRGQCMSQHLLQANVACTDSRTDRHMDGHVEAGELWLAGEDRSWSVG